MEKQEQKKIKKVLVIVIIIIGVIIFGGFIYSKIILPQLILSDTRNSVEDASQKMENQLIQMFNIQIEQYLGEGQSGYKVNSLINNVIAKINMEEDERKIIIVLDNEEIEDTSKIKSSQKYTVTSEKDSEGYISKVIIKTEGLIEDNLQSEVETEEEIDNEESYENKSQIDIENENEQEVDSNSESSYFENALTQFEKQAIQSFNMQIEQYLGEGKEGYVVNSLINTIFKINNVEPERQIMIVTDDDDIQAQSKASVSNKYTITSEKNYEGYIIKVNILKEIAE